jgi:putative hydrolase of the HAD superfamily
VFINLDKPATQRHLDEFGIHQLEDSILSLNNQYEKGEVSTEVFIEGYLNTYPNLTKEAMVDAWNSILIDLPAYRLEFLQQLKKEGNYRMFLLSNTNELHINWVKANVEFYNAFKSCFEQFYLSHEIHLRKPETEIFQFVLGQNKLLAEETLFIDDTQEHILSAKSLGIQTWHLDPKTDDVTDLFRKIFSEK